MVSYRRNRIAGGTYFFTVTLRDRKSALLIRHIELLREAVQRTKIAKPFAIDAWVVLPEHMHAIWTLPPGDTDYSARWHSIKACFSHELAKLLENPQRNAKGAAILIMASDRLYTASRSLAHTSKVTEIIGFTFL